MPILTILHQKLLIYVIIYPEIGTIYDTSGIIYAKSGMIYTKNGIC